MSVDDEGESVGSFVELVELVGAVGSFAGDEGESVGSFVDSSKVLSVGSDVGGA